MRCCFGTLVIISLLAACSGGGDGGNGITPPTGTPAITVSTSSSSAIAEQGSTATVPISITRVNGATGAVTLSAEGLPVGVTAAFTPNPIADGSTASTLTVTVGANAVVGTATVTVRATAPGVAAQTATAQLSVTAAVVPAYTIRTGAENVMLNAGESFSTSVSITRSSGFTGTVALAMDGAPAGVTGTFTPNPATGTTATLTVSSSTAATAGTYTLTVRGTATGLADRTAPPITLVIANPPAFTLTATNVSVTSGSVGASAVTITRTGGFTGAVTLSTASVPPNVTVAYSQNPTTANAVTISFTVAAGSTPGLYTIVLNGTGTGVANQSIIVSLTVIAPSGGGNVTWQFCDVARVPLWFAFRDGTTGAWTRVLASGANSFTFNLTQAVGAVAYVRNEGGDTNAEVFYGSRLDLQTFLTQECLDNPSAGKTLNGAVVGLSATESANIFLGGAEGSATFGALSYQLENVPAGSLDLFGVRLNATIGPPPSSTPNRMFLQRNVNVAAGGTLPAVDFTGGSSFAPATANITIANGGTDQLFLASVIAFASGTEANFVPQPFATGATRTFFGIPTALLTPGDLHAAFILASAASTQDQRILYSYFRTVADRTLTLGPLLTAVSLSSSTSGGLARPKAKANFQTEYGDAFGVTFSQNNGSRAVTISAFRGYFASGGSEFELETPNFSGIDGFNSAWGMIPGVPTIAEVSAIGGVASGVITMPTDGSTWRLAARSMTFVP